MYLPIPPMLPPALVSIVYTVYSNEQHVSSTKQFAQSTVILKMHEHRVAQSQQSPLHMCKTTDYSGAFYQLVCFVIVISRCEFNIEVIAQVRGGAKDKGNKILNTASRI